MTSRIRRSPSSAISTLEPDAKPAGTQSLRLDKWLWFARLFKSRSLASRFCTEGRIRIAGKVVRKAHQAVRPGDVLTFAQGSRVRVIKIAALGVRRGPAARARQLYEDLTPKAPPKPQVPVVAARLRGAGRPTKAERRAMARLTGR